VTDGNLDCYCAACCTDYRYGTRHVCPDPVQGPPTPPKPFVKRWDPIGACWVHCMVENGKAWEPALGTYTDVKPGELGK
jgi:hypothetical protein